MGNTYTGSNVGKAGLEITDIADGGSVDAFGVSKIEVSSGTLTDDGNGTVTLTTGGGGGGGVTTISFGTTGLTPALAASGVVAVAGTLVVANGGTGATSLTDHGVLVGSGTGAITALGEADSGDLIIGSAGADPVIAQLTDGGGVTATGGAGSITLGTDGILQDLDTLGAPTADGEFIVATGAGTFAYETDDTALGSLGIAHGREEFNLDGGGALATMGVTAASVSATNTIIYQIEFEVGVVTQNRPSNIDSGRGVGIGFGISCDLLGPPGESVFVNWMTIG